MTTADERRRRVRDVLGDYRFDPYHRNPSPAEIKSLQADGIEPQGAVVYVGTPEPRGKMRRFHRQANCGPLLRGTGDMKPIPIEQDEAVRRGFAPCGMCVGPLDTEAVSR